MKKRAIAYKNQYKLAFTPSLEYHLFLTYGEYLLKNSTIRFCPILFEPKFTESQYLYPGRQFILLAQIKRKKSDFTDYFKYWDHYEQLRDSIRVNSHYENIRMTQSMFNYQHIADEKLKYEQEAARQMIIIYQILIITVFLFLTGFFLFSKRTEEKRKSYLT